MTITLNSKSLHTKNSDTRMAVSVNIIELSDYTDTKIPDVRL